MRPTLLAALRCNPHIKTLAERILGFWDPLLHLDNTNLCNYLHNKVHSGNRIELSLLSSFLVVAQQKVSLRK